MLRHRQHWIFDLDGTLTLPTHDFAALRRELGLPAGLSILAGIAQRPEHERAALKQAVADWEWAHVEHARAAPDAVALLAALGDRQVGILTRNRRDVALRTLAVIGLADRFDPADVIGRDETTPKPSPAGVRFLLDQWGAAPSDGVMVGDFEDDLAAGRAAGVATVHIDRHGAVAWPELTDRRVTALDALLR